VLGGGDLAQRVRSYGSKISMISLADLGKVSPVWVGRKVSNQHPTSRRDPLQVATTGAHQAAQQDFCWAPAGTQLSVNKDLSLSASSGGRVGDFEPHPGLHL
jgi:hypothetical protein